MAVSNYQCDPSLGTCPYTQAFLQCVSLPSHSLYPSCVLPPPVSPYCHANLLLSLRITHTHPGGVRPSPGPWRSLTSPAHRQAVGAGWCRRPRVDMEGPGLGQKVWRIAVALGSTVVYPASSPDSLPCSAPAAQSALRAAETARDINDHLTGSSSSNSSSSSSSSSRGSKTGGSSSIAGRSRQGPAVVRGTGSISQYTRSAL